MAAIALAALTQGDALGGYIGPFKPTATGTELAYVVLVVDTVKQEKRAFFLNVAIPDGGTLQDLRTLSTTAIVNAAAAGGITLPRAGVLLPAIQQGL